jgi:hypothetical protein
MQIGGGSDDEGFGGGLSGIDADGNRISKGDKVGEVSS